MEPLYLGRPSTFCPLKWRVSTENDLSFTYNINLTSDLDKVRFLTSDTSASSVIFQDEEITGLLGMESNIYMAASIALRQRAAAFVTKAIKYQVGTAGGNAALMVDRSRIIKNFMDLAEKLEAWAIGSIDESFDRLAFDIDVYGRDRSEYQGINYGSDDWDLFNP